MNAAFSYATKKDCWRAVSYSGRIPQDVVHSQILTCQNVLGFTVENNSSLRGG